MANIRALILIAVGLLAMHFQEASSPDPDDSSLGKTRQLHMIAFNNKALLYGELANKTGCGVAECAWACLYDERCGSFNYFALNLTCVLNEAVDDLRLSQLNETEGSTFYGNPSLG